MAKKKAASTEGPAPFEEALAELEQTVAQLEGGKLGLAESLAAYEHGVRRLKGCYQQLADAERRIELGQAVGPDGRVTSTPLGDESSADLAEK
ncbi:MAG TPA: exodeoxyribonuclease VII small subunit, partial [Lacipirellulaceae bacterium]|nr:exodeoxyribonuclease VII small subunit [Lacipirellulaceae bacterium]